MTLQLAVTSKGHKVLDTRWRGQTRNEDYARLYYIVDGTATISHHKRQWRLLPGQLHLVPPGSHLKYSCPRRIQIIWFHITLSCSSFSGLFRNNDFRYVHNPSDTNAIYGKMSRLLMITDRDDPYSRLQSTSHLLELISLFFRFPYARNKPALMKKTARFDAVLSYIDSHLKEKMTLHDLAGTAAYEKTYFSFLFKKLYGVSPKRFILNKRIEKAQSFLKNTDMKLEAIARELGFHDPFHFSKTYKRMTGRNPALFRRKNQTRMP